jgi:hypothetical protein
MNAYELVQYIHMYQNVGKEHLSSMSRVVSVDSRMNLDELCTIHGLLIYQNEYTNLRQMVYRARDTLSQLKVDAKAVKPLKVRRDSLLDSLREWFGSICKDRAYWMQLVERSDQSSLEME